VSDSGANRSARSRPKEVWIAAGILLIQVLAFLVPALSAVVDLLNPEPHPDFGEFLGNGAEIFLIVFAAPYVAGVLCLVIGLGRLRTWARRGTIGFEIVQAGFLLVFTPSYTDWNLVSIFILLGLPIAVVGLLANRRVANAFTAARPDGWMF
jgi:hypothetical protein